MSIYVQSKDFVGITPRVPLTVDDFFRHCSALKSKYTEYDQRSVFPFDLQVDGAVALLTFDDRNWLKSFDDFVSDNEDVLHDLTDYPVLWVDNETGYTTSVYKFGEDMIARDKDDHQYYSVIINPQ